ncbi:hypothetical protein [Phytoactinopolyspora limicola]|nr:hypothetical protein [Phytoactinopolyspora limicola]
MARRHDVSHWLLSQFLTEDDERVDKSLHLMATEVLPNVRAALAS